MSRFDEKKPVAPALLAAIVVGVLMGIGAFVALYWVRPPMLVSQGILYTVPVNWLWHEFLSGFGSSTCGPGIGGLLNLDCSLSVGWYRAFTERGLGASVGVRAVGILIAGIVAAVTAFIGIYRITTPTDRLRHVDGPNLLRNRQAVRALRKLLRRAVREFGAGLWLAPGVQLSRGQEIENLLLVGMQGAGKTVILRAILEQAIVRRDMVLIHDSKGDMVAGLPTERFILLAPHDARSAGWAVADDVTTWQAADALAARTIPEARDPTWSNAARQVLSAMLAELIRANPGSWNWMDLYQLLLLPAAELKQVLDRAGSPAARYINVEESGDPTKTSFGVLVTLWAAAMNVVRPLAEAWVDPETRRFSVRSWVRSGGKPARVIVIQRSSAFPELSEMLSGAIVETLAGVLADPAVPIDPARRLTLMLDELYQLGRIKRFEEMLAVGREKGLMTIAAIQDPAQLIERYGVHVADQLMTLLGLKIISRMVRGPSSNKLSKELIGDRRVEWTETNTSRTSGGGSGGQGSTTTNSTKRDAVVSLFGADRIERDLGVKVISGKKTIRALLLGLGDCYLLDWPLTIWPKRRPAHVPARWLREE